MVRLLILTVAMSSGGLAAWMTLAGDPAGTPPPVIVETAPAVAMEEVLVAALDLEQGASISDASVRWQAWPADAVAAGFISRSSRPEAPATLEGSLVRSQFRSGEPIREDKLAAAGSGYMAALLPAGKRAVAVRISAQSTAGGFVLPNDRVDVVHTVSLPATDGTGTEVLSRTILSNIRVLAVDQTQNADPANPQMVVLGETATLELDLAQVETIAAAEASGTLSLALRSVADNTQHIETPARRSNATVRVHRQGKIEAVKVSPHRAAANNR